VLSPLLANLYMRRFVLGWKALGHEQRLDAHIVNDADDFVILTRGNAEEAMTTMRDMMGKLKLTVNEKKTRKCSLPDETFTFLGFSFGRQVSWKSGRAYVAPAPATKKVQAICDKISEETGCQTTFRSEREQVAKLNQMLVGWFDEREVETEQGGILWPRQPKGVATRMAHLTHRATSRLHLCHDGGNPII